MSAITIETIYDIWDAMKSLIPAKDKLEAAERIIKICDEAGIDKQDVEELTDNDKILETAFNRYYIDDEEYDEDDEWED
jgi:division protein CdvB (Snf7/Vps24/ESCRT-III family)